MKGIELFGKPKTYAMDITGFPKMAETEDGSWYRKDEVDALIDKILRTLTQEGESNA